MAHTIYIAQTARLAQRLTPKPSGSKTRSFRTYRTPEFSSCWNHAGARRIAFMSITFAFLSAPVQGLLAIFASHVLGGTSTLYGAMLAMIGLGSLIGAYLLGRLPQYYPRHHLIPLAMCLFSVFGLLYSFSNVVWLTLPLLIFCGMFWLLTLNPLNTATQLLAPDEQRGRIMSVMLVCTQGAMPIGHLCAGALAHVMAPQLIVRSMLALLLLIALGFLFRREPAIDQMERRGVEPESLLGAVREAVTAESHLPHPGASVRIPRPGTLQ